MPLVDWIYVAAVGHRMPAILLRAIMCAIILLPPTFLMGASLPAVARWIQATPRGVSWLGLLYGANTAGAVFGCLLAGFYLLREFDMASATYFAAGLNALIGFISFSVAKVTPDQSTDEASGAPSSGEKQSPAEISVLPPIAAGQLEHLSYDCSFRRIRPGRRSGLDAAARPDARCDRLHFLDYSGRFFGRTRHRQHSRLSGFAFRARSCRTRLQPIAISCGHRVDGVLAREFASLLADQSAALARSVVHIPN